MSKDYEGQDPIAIAKQAERDLNSHQAKHGVSTADSSKNPPTFTLPNYQANTSLPATESGVDTSVTNKFPGSTVKVGPAASGREIPVDEGGDLISKPGEKGGSGQ